jgi:hypothetical protein
MGSALDYASQELQSNKEIVLEAVKKNGGAILLSKKFQNDREVVLGAVKQDGFSLEINFNKNQLIKFIC